MRFRNNAPVSKGGAIVPLKLRYAMSMTPNPETPPPSGTVTQAMIDFADAWQALAEPTHAGMAQDEAHQREMVAATGVIAPRADCDYVAVQAGDWTSANTWLRRSDDTFAVPVAGAKIGVPSGITVTMDNNTTTVFYSLRVDGTVTWAIDQDTKLYIDDTIVINHGGVWEHGTVANPIPAAYTSECVFPSQTNLDGAKEKLLLQRGFLGMGANSMHPGGKIHIHGAAKDHWGTTNQSLSVGATSVTLDAAPTGWEVGDEIQIMATDVYNWASAFPRTWSAPRVDNVTITNISGATITFSPATTYAHSVPTATGMTDLKYYVVNFTRNVKYYSPVNTPIHQRGHWMGMGDGIDVRYAEFNWLGRTNKALNVPSFDATNDAARIAENGGVGDPDFTPTDNVRGRYNFHIHRSGVATGQPFATVTGISCTEAPGWLIAHHQSNANFTECVGRGFLGSGMVAEFGSEAGLWKDCYMGEGRQIESYQGGQSDKAEYLELGGVVNGVDRTYGNDFGRNNNAYWFKGRAVEVEGCVAAGCGRGLVWMGRGTFGNAASPNPTTTPEVRVFYGYRGITGLVSANSPVLRVKNCVIVGTEIPILVIKSAPSQQHSLRTHIHTNDFWNNAGRLEFEYTGHYTLDNNRFLRTSRDILRSGGAIFFASATSDFYASNNIVQGYPTYVVQKQITDILFDTYDHGNVVVDDHTTDAANLLTFAGADSPDNTTLAKVVASGDYSDIDPTWTPSAEPVWPTGEIFGTQWYQFAGNMTTEFETRNRIHELGSGLNINAGLKAQFDLTGLQLMLGRYGYYTYTHPTHGASNYLLVPDLISRKLPTTPGGDIPVRYLTVPVRLTGVSLTNYTDQGALPQRYVDCIALGDPGIADPGSPAAGAAAYVVYEDIFGTGNLYEGL